MFLVLIFQINKIAEINPIKKLNRSHNGNRKIKAMHKARMYSNTLKNKKDIQINMDELK